MQLSSRRRYKLVKVDVGSPRNLQFDGNFADTLETELRDDENNNSEGNWFAICFKD